MTKVVMGRGWGWTHFCCYHSELLLRLKYTRSTASLWHFLFLFNCPKRDKELTMCVTCCTSYNSISVTQDTQVHKPATQVTILQWWSAIPKYTALQFKFQ